MGAAYGGGVLAYWTDFSSDRASAIAAQPLPCIHCFRKVFCCLDMMCIALYGVHVCVFTGRALRLFIMEYIYRS